MATSEIELKFRIPPASRAAVREAMSGAGAQRIRLVAQYLDTPDSRLASNAIAWRLRQEGRRWVQTLKAPGEHAIERFEHEVPVRAPAVPDALRHAGTPAGDRLIKLIEKARADGLEIGTRFATQVTRIHRQVRIRGAVVEIAWDEGVIVAGDARRPVAELEFEVVRGSAGAMVALAERWRRKYGLQIDTRSKAQHGHWLERRQPDPPVRKARMPQYAATATPSTAFRAVLAECLEQILDNAVGLADGTPQLRVDHVHQLRVGIRRLRSALRIFRGWVAEPPAVLVDGLRALFSELGAVRDADVQAHGIAAELRAAGAPPIEPDARATPPDPAAVVTLDATQSLLLAWVGWSVDAAGLPVERPGVVSGGGAAAAAAAPVAADPSAAPAAPAHVRNERAITAITAPDAATGTAALPTSAPLPSLADQAERRLRRWHKDIARDVDALATLEVEQIHDLRKRIKRQRYAVEFLAPLLRRREVERYREALGAVQERMGELTDLYVAHEQYEQAAQVDPAAWFAVGWVAARTPAAREAIVKPLRALSRMDPPRARRA